MYFVPEMGEDFSDLMKFRMPLFILRHSFIILVNISSLMKLASNAR